MTQDGKVEKEKVEKKVDPRVRVMTFGKAWADLLRQDPASQAKYILFSVGTLGYQISQQDFESVREPGERPDLFALLSENTTAASSWVMKLQYYVKKAQVVLIDTDVLDSAVGQEILRNAAAMKKPAYAVGVTSSTSALAPYYVRGIAFPGTVKDLHDLIDRALAQAQAQAAPTPTVIRSPSTPPMPRGELIEKIKADEADKKAPPPPPAEPAPNAVETL